MKNVIFLFLTACVFAGCAGKAESGKEIISVSIPPQKYLVEKISGGKYHINVLVPSGFSPETYELTPSQMKMLADSRVYFMTGHLIFENNWRRKFGEMKSELMIVDLSEGIDLITTEYAHDDHSHYGTDPHTWVSPGSMKIMAENIYNFLCRMDEESKEFYTEGYNSLQNEIENADSILNELFRDIKNRSFLIFHPALGYLARDYDLEQIPVEFEGKTPPPAYMQKIVEIAGRKKLKAILIQKEFNIENARAVAREINGEIIQIDPLDEDWYNQIIFIGNTLKKILNAEL